MEHTTHQMNDGGCKPRRVKRALRAFAAAAALAVAAPMFVGGSPAGASQFNLEFDTYCNANHAITAWSPDLTHYAGWQVVWAPVLYRWNGAKWVRYLSGPTQTQGASTADWASFSEGAQNVAFTRLPNGYYQVHDIYAWVYNGQKTGAYSLDYVGTHKLDGRSYYYGASVPTWQSSTSSYCYMS